jgi:hypothetical protein
MCETLKESVGCIQDTGQDAKTEIWTKRRNNMTGRQFAKTIGAGAALAVVVLAGMLITPSGQARNENDGNNNDGNNDQSKVKIGFQIAPVKLNLDGKNRDLVGLGSYIVNAQGGCNDCHFAPTGPEYQPGGDPYQGQHPTVVNPDNYLGGGLDFGPIDPLGQGAHIFPRNLTPDKTGRPEGGRTFEEFRTIIRTGADLDHLHPTCTGATNITCIPAPIDGSLLQIMPWPVYGNMTDHDLRAVYEYLSAIPCIDTIVAGQPQLRHDCH